MPGGRALGADQACKLPSPFESGGRSATMRARSVNRPVITCSCMSIVCTRAGFIARRRIRRTLRQFVDDACALGGGDVALLLRRLLVAGTDDFGRVQAALALTCQALLLPRPVHSTSEASSPRPTPRRGAYILQPLSNKELYGLASITLVQLERIYALPAASVAERGLAPEAAFCLAHASLAGRVQPRSGRALSCNGCSGCALSCCASAEPFARPFAAVPPAVMKALSCIPAPPSGSCRLRDRCNGSGEPRKQREMLGGARSCAARRCRRSVHFPR
jgi:hypothetical protein